MSSVPRDMSHVTSFLQSGGASRWRVCYQQSLPRFVFVMTTVQEFMTVNVSIRGNGKLISQNQLTLLCISQDKLYVL